LEREVTGITVEVVTISQLIMMIRVSGLGTQNATNRNGLRNTTFDDEKQMGTNDDPKTSQYMVTYILSILISAAALIGFVALFL
jgi:hypothetical protein